MRFTARTLATGLLAFLMAAPAMAAEKSGLSNADKDEVRKIIRDYLVEHPEVISDAINAMQAKEDKAREEKQAVALKKNKAEIFSIADGTIIGNPKGDVTFVEFFDYNCGYCKSMFPAMMDLLKQDGKVRLILKEFPILGPSSLTASRAALASRRQGKYAELHVALLGHKGSLTDDMIFQIAKDVGLDVKKLQDDMKAPEIAVLLGKNHDLADELAIDGTPALVIGDTLVPGAVGKGRLAELIAAERK